MMNCQLKFYLFPHIDRKKSIHIYSKYNQAEFFLDKSVIFEVIKELLISEFKVDVKLISPEKLLDDDLDLDSLDMVDLIISLNDYIGEKVNPGLFKNAHTVADVVDLVQPLWK